MSNREEAGLETIGFVGLGNMGLPMALNLQRANVPLVVHDVQPVKAGALRAAGAEAVDDIAGMAQRADVVLTMLPDAPDVVACVLGDQGLRHHARPGALVVDMSTIAPSITDRLARELAADGIGFVDAAVGGTVADAARGESLFMVGGAAADVSRLRPLLEIMGGSVHHCGPVGTGIRTKLINAYLAVATGQLCAEALAFAAGLGLSMTTLLRVLTQTTANNGHLTETWPTKTLAGDLSPGFTLAMAAKDLSLAVEEGNAHTVPLATGQAALAAIDAVCGHPEFDNKDMSVLLDAACDAIGVETPRL